MSLAVVSTSQSRHRRRRDVRGVVEGLRRARHPHASGGRLAQALADELLDDRDLLLDVAHFVVEKVAAAAPRRRVMPSAKERAEHQATEKKAVKAVVARVKEMVALDMTVTLLDGTQKALRYCFGHELEQLGAAYQRIAERVGADVMVGEALTSAEAQALMQVNV